MLSVGGYGVVGPAGTEKDSGDRGSSWAGATVRLYNAVDFLSATHSLGRNKGWRVYLKGPPVLLGL